MHELPQFPEHLKTISKEDWDKLFKLIDELKETGNITKYVSIFATYDDVEILQKIITTLNELDLIVGFDWITWKEGWVFANNIKQDKETYDLITLCKIITQIVRHDRFCSGYLVDKINDGTVVKILEGMRQLIFND